MPEIDRPDIPQELAGLGVQRDHVAVGGAAEHPPAGDGDAAIGVERLGALRRVLVFPHLLAGLGVQRIGVVRRGDIEHAVIDDRHRLEAVLDAELRRAHRLQLCRVGLVDLLEARIAMRLVVLVVHQPAVVGLGRGIQLLLGGAAGRRLVDALRRGPDGELLLAGTLRGRIARLVALPVAAVGRGCAARRRARSALAGCGLLAAAVRLPVLRRLRAVHLGLDVADGHLAEIIAETVAHIARHGGDLCVRQLVAVAEGRHAAAAMDDLVDHVIDVRKSVVARQLLADAAAAIGAVAPRTALRLEDLLAGRPGRPCGSRRQPERQAGDGAGEQSRPGPNGAASRQGFWCWQSRHRYLLTCDATNRNRPVSPMFPKAPMLPIIKT